MRIQLQKVGKKFNKEWVFRNLDYEFAMGTNYAILGNNGSGKSTLLQLIAGSILPTEGAVNYEINNLLLIKDRVYEQVALASPYLELFEEFTLTEAIAFHFKFKRLIKSIDVNTVPDLSLFTEKDKTKQVKNFSSGMKQRLRLALAILSDTPLLLLDEPSSNLDKNGVEWYRQMIKNYTANKLIVVCSNRQEQEYDFCNQQLVMEDFK